MLGSAPGPLQGLLTSILNEVSFIHFHTSPLLGSAGYRSYYFIHVVNSLQELLYMINQVEIVHYLILKISHFMDLGRKGCEGNTGGLVFTE